MTISCLSRPISTFNGKEAALALSRSWTGQQRIQRHTHTRNQQSTIRSKRRQLVIAELIISVKPIDAIPLCLCLFVSVYLYNYISNIDRWAISVSLSLSIWSLSGLSLWTAQFWWIVKRSLSLFLLIWSSDCTPCWIPFPHSILPSPAVLNINTLCPVLSLARNYTLFFWHAFPHHSFLIFLNILLLFPVVLLLLILRILCCVPSCGYHYVHPVRSNVSTSEKSNKPCNARHITTSYEIISLARFSLRSWDDCVMQS